MKIHRVVTMLGATTSTGKLADDMYDLNNKTYYSKAEQRDIPISHMDFQHMVRAFVKLSEQEDMLDRSKHMGKVADLVAKIERLEGIIEEKDEHIDKLSKEEHRWRKAYDEKFNSKGYEYMFSEIPNTEYGEKLVKSMRAYLNDETYTMRVRGQHLKKELYGQGRAYWGQSIEDSSHLRVYINKKQIKWKDIK
tara:strand:+ start:104 stop:682 length:579 start_codon:yes stop_codon:yes gene_type:complete